MVEKLLYPGLPREIKGPSEIEYDSDFTRTKLITTKGKLLSTN